MTPERARLFYSPNAKPDLGEVHGINIRTGARRVVRPAPAEPVQKVSKPVRAPVVVSVSVYPVTRAVHERIIKAVCQIFDIRLNELKSERRNLKAVEARQTAMALMILLTKHSTISVGRTFNRDHTTVMHAIRKMQPLIDAVEAQMPPESESITGWVTALRDRLASNEWIQARRARTRSGKLAKSTHCVHGHLYTAENTRIKPDGKRICRTCAAYQTRRRYEARKQARHFARSEPA